MTQPNPELAARLEKYLGQTPQIDATAYVAPQATVVHLADDFPAILGKHVTIGHLAMIHACTIGDECLIGMHAIILDGAVIGAQSLVGAGSLVTKGTKIPPGSLAVGSPARVVRLLTPEEKADLRASAEKYIQVAAAHAKRGQKLEAKS